MFSFVEDIKSYFCFSAGSNSTSKLEEQIIERSNSLGNIEEIREETCQPLPVVGKTDQGKKLQYNDFFLFILLHYSFTRCKNTVASSCMTQAGDQPLAPNFYGKLYSFFFTYEGKQCQELKYGRPLPPFASLTTLGKSAIAF